MSSRPIYGNPSRNGKRRIILACIILVGVVSFADLADFVTEASGRGLVIEFGWDTPSIPWLCENAATVECTIAFDGIILDLAQREGQGSLSWIAWSGDLIPSDVLENAEEDISLLNDANLTRLRDNSFLRLNSSGWSEPPDWFDGDFNSVVSNVAFMAAAVNETSLAGIAFDPEDYFSSCWHYPSREYSGTKTFAQYQAQVRQRGGEIASAIKSACPGRDFVMLFTFANSLPFLSTDWWGHPLSEDTYGLLPAFIDGLLDEACGQIRIIDGLESAYPHMTLEQFEGSVSNYEDGATLSADPARYLSCVGIGFGTWMDYRSDEFGWYTDPNEFHLNHFTPETFNQAMGYSTDLSEYSWVYTQVPDWYLGTVPEAYFDALADVTGLPPTTACAERWAWLLRAKYPLPADAAEDVHPEVVLSWEAGMKAALHDVYFGTDVNAVGDANTSETLDVYVGRQDGCEYAPGAVLEFGQTYYWRIDEVNDVNIWPGRVWSFTVVDDDRKASNPHPADGDTNVPRDTILSWSPGVVASSHDVYIGADFDAVNDANTSSSPEFKGSQNVDANSYEPSGPFMVGRTYYWRIDEINPGYGDSRGDVWSFTVEEYTVLDDMESYNDDAHMADTWQADPYPDANNGARVYLEDSIVHGGQKSMKFMFDIDWGSYFTAARIYSTAQDWTAAGVHHLSLWFHGYEHNLVDDQMYVLLKDGTGHSASIPYDGDPNNITLEEWQEWNVALQDFNDAGVNVGDVREIVIGAESLYWAGILYFDDIRLYGPRCIPDFQPAADFTDDCLVNFVDFAVLADQWLKPPGSPSADIAQPPDGIVDMWDLALLVEDWLEEKLWP